MCYAGRSSVEIYKLPEPNVSEVYDESRPLPVVTMVLDYAWDFGTNLGFPTNRVNAEGFFVDRVGDTKGGRKGDIYLLTNYNEPSRRHMQRLGKVGVEVHENFVAPAFTSYQIENVGTPYNVYDEPKEWVEAAFWNIGCVNNLRIHLN